MEMSKHHTIYGTWIAEDDIAFYDWVAGDSPELIADGLAVELPTDAAAPEMMSPKVIRELHRRFGTKGIPSGNAYGTMPWYKLIRTGKVVLDDLP